MTHETDYNRILRMTTYSGAITCAIYARVTGSTHLSQRLCEMERAGMITVKRIWQQDPRTKKRFLMYRIKKLKTK